jgi:hypothetical protein
MPGSAPEEEGDKHSRVSKFVKLNVLDFDLL